MNDLGNQRGRHARVDTSNPNRPRLVDLPMVDREDLLFEQSRPSEDFNQAEYYGISQKKGISRPIIFGIIAAVLVIALGAGAAFAFFGKQEPAAPVKEEVKTVNATVKADKVYLVSAEAARGAVLTDVQPATELTGDYVGKFYRATYQGVTVYVEKRWVRMSTEKAPESWTGYAAENAVVYGRASLSGDPATTVPVNQEITVLDSFAGLLFVRTADGVEGYMAESGVSREKTELPEEVQEYTTYSYSDYSYSDDGGSSSGSSSSGSSSESAPSPAPAPPAPSPSTPSTSGDGDEITMPTAAVSNWAKGLVLDVAWADEAPSQGADAKKAMVLCDQTPLYAYAFNRGDFVTVKVDSLYEEALAHPVEAVSAANGAGNVAAANTSQPEASGAQKPRGASDDDDKISKTSNANTATSNTANSSPAAPKSEKKQQLTIVVNGQNCAIDREVLQLESDTRFDRCEGFAKDGAVLYSDYKLEHSSRDLERNDALVAIDVIGATYVIQDGDTIAYLDMGFFSREKIEDPDADDGEEGEDSNWTAPSYSYTPSSGSGSSSSESSSSSGSSSGSPAPAPSTPAPNTSSDSAEWTKPTL